MPVPTLARLVGGEWRAPEDGRTIDVTDPADVRRVVARVPTMRAEEVPAVYEAAVTGLRTWRRTPALERGTILRRAADLLGERAPEIVTDLVAEMGKTTAEATVEVTKSADFLDYYASLARLPCGDLLNDARPGTQTSVRTEPVGVVQTVTPWNDPPLTPARKLGPGSVGHRAVPGRVPPAGPRAHLPGARAGLSGAGSGLSVPRRALHAAGRRHRGHRAEHGAGYGPRRATAAEISAPGTWPRPCADPGPGGWPGRTGGPACRNCARRRGRWSACPTPLPAATSALAIADHIAGQLAPTAY